MTSKRTLTPASIRKIVNRVTKMVRSYGAPADDPDFYQAKNAVRAFLKKETGTPVFCAVEPRRGRDATATVILAIGDNHIERVEI